MHFGSSGGHDAILGKLKGETTMTAQAYRYPKSDWDAARARAHCEKAGGTWGG